MKSTNKFSPEVKERVVRMVLEQRGESIVMGDSRAESPHDWLRSAYVDGIGQF